MITTGDFSLQKKLRESIHSLIADYNYLKGNNDIGAYLSIHVEQKDRGHVPFCYINKIHAAEYMKRIGNYRQLNGVASYRTSKPPVEP